MNTQTPYPILFITGLPGSGKTTLAQSIVRDASLQGLDVMLLDTDDPNVSFLEEDPSRVIFEQAKEVAQNTPVIASGLFGDTTFKQEISNWGWTIWVQTRVSVCIDRCASAYDGISISPSRPWSQVPAYQFAPPENYYITLLGEHPVPASVVQMLLNWLGEPSKYHSQKKRDYA